MPKPIAKRRNVKSRPKTRPAAATDALKRRRPPALTSAMSAMLGRAHAGQPLNTGLRGKSEHGGAELTRAALHQRGLLKKNEITEAGRAALVQAVNSHVVDEHEKARNFLTLEEFGQMLAGARLSRHAARDTAMLYLLFQHGYRASELCRAKRDDFDGRRARVWVRRLKGSLSTDQPITGNALRALKTYLHSRTDRLPWLFVSERGTPFTRQGLYYLITVIAQRAGLQHVHPHTLRHSCGYALADKGADARLIQDYLGHRDLRHTSRYTRTAAKRFEGLWEE